MAAQRTYLAIDLKSFYASVECVDRHLDQSGGGGRLPHRKDHLPCGIALPESLQDTRQSAAV